MLGPSLDFILWYLESYAVPQGCVIAFEPVESLKDQLLLSCEANKIENVHVESLAVGAKSGQAEFWIHEDPKGGLGTSSSLKRSSGKGEGTTRVVSIDDYIQRNKIAKVDLIKVDVEGSGARCFEGSIDNSKTSWTYSYC
ncbi:MAG: hypothetical protein KatS3mg078_1682 [Deltaproteobacteria bacterium]|nr:MAG: hypothetical protein KatS3mg078_1682 [Deltaproteobacteria bacterium]